MPRRRQRPPTPLRSPRRPTVAAAEKPSHERRRNSPRPVGIPVALYRLFTRFGAGNPSGDHSFVFESWGGDWQARPQSCAGANIPEMCRSAGLPRPPSTRKREARVRRHHRFRADCDILDRKPSSRRWSPGTGTRIALLATLVGLALSFATAATAGPVRLGFWLTASEITARPMSGTPWTRLKAAADGSLGTPNLADNNTDHDARTLAAALVYARTGIASYRTKAANGIMAAIGTENNYGASWLSVGMNLNSYVIAADIVNLAEYSPSSDAQFRSWLSTLRNRVIGSSHARLDEQRPPEQLGHVRRRNPRLGRPLSGRRRRYRQCGQDLPGHAG